MKAFLRKFLVDSVGQRDDWYVFRRLEAPIDPISEFSSVVVWQPDGKLGDAIVTSYLLDSLKAAAPGLALYVACPSRVWGFYELLGLCAGRLEPERPARLRGQLPELHRSRLLFISMESFHSLAAFVAIRRLRPKEAVGFNVGPYKAFTRSVVEATYQEPRTSIFDRVVNLCRLLGIPYRDTCPLQLERRRTPQGSPRSVFFNTFAASKDRTFSEKSIETILSAIAETVKGPLKIYLGVKPDAPLPELPAAADAGRLALEPVGDVSIRELLAILREVDGVITPDTATAHIAAVFDTPQAVFYDEPRYSPVVWRPHSDKAVQVLPREAGDVNGFCEAQARSAIQSILSKAA
jgi:ADP-heptose:LPS heptosyltransferase